MRSGSVHHLIVAVAFVGAMVVGCSGDDGAAAPDLTTATADGSEAELSFGEEVFPGTPELVIANSPGSVTTSGRQRIMTALVGGDNNTFLGNSSRPLTVAYEPVSGNSSGGSVEATWLTTNASSLGLYVSTYSFEEAGIWQITVKDGTREVAASLFEVLDESPVPQPGEDAPRSQTATAETEAELAAVSTDQAPDPSFYDLSIADAVGNGQPTMIVFATPAFCQTALCGPTLEFVKGATADHPDVDVVHVEPFDLALASSGTLESIATMDDYGLATEPWIFLADPEGKITHSFEGIIGQRELEDALSE